MCYLYRLTVGYSTPLSMWVRCSKPLYLLTVGTHSPPLCMGPVFETPVSFDGGYILHTPLPSVWVRCSKPLYLLTVGIYSPPLCTGLVFKTPVSFDGGFILPSPPYGSGIRNPCII